MSAFQEQESTNGSTVFDYCFIIDNI